MAAAAHVGIVMVDQPTQGNSEAGWSCREVIKGLMKFLLAFVLGSVILCAILFACMIALETFKLVVDVLCLDQVTRCITITVLSLILAFAMMYCFHYDAYAARRDSIAGKFVAKFHLGLLEEICTKVLSNIAQNLHFNLLLRTLEWCLIALIYGKIGDAQMKEAMLLGDELAKAISYDYGNVLIVTIVTIIVICLHYTRCSQNLKENILKASSEQNCSKVLEICLKAYGENAVILFIHFVYFANVVSFFTLFAALSGSITRDFLASLTWFSALYMLAAPAYVIYLGICIAVESFIDCSRR